MNMDGRLATIIASSAFGAKLGEMIEVTQDGLTWTLSPRPDLIGNPLLPALHGGAATAFLELACGAIVAHSLDREVLPRLISVNVQFLAPMRLRDITTQPTILRTGRRIAVVHADAWQEDFSSPVCAAQCEFALSA